MHKYLNRLRLRRNKSEAFTAIPNGGTAHNVANVMAADLMESLLAAMDEVAR